MQDADCQVLRFFPTYCCTISGDLTSLALAKLPNPHPHSNHQEVKKTETGSLSCLKKTTGYCQFHFHSHHIDYSFVYKVTVNCRNIWNYFRCPGLHPNLRFHSHNKGDRWTVSTSRWQQLSVHGNVPQSAETFAISTEYVLWVSVYTTRAWSSLLSYCIFVMITKWIQKEYSQHTENIVEIQPEWILQNERGKIC